MEDPHPKRITEWITRTVLMNNHRSHHNPLSQLKAFLKDTVRPRSFARAMKEVSRLAVALDGTDVKSKIMEAEL